ncbi:MAG: CBS domain-containing protein [Methanomicrobiales archaeon]
MQASDIMTSPVYAVAPDENVGHARNLMLRNRISRVLVMRGEDLCGILTKKDIGYRLRQSEPKWRRRPIDRIPVQLLMTADPITVDPGTTTAEIARIMVEHDISGLPVVGGGAVIGMVTKSDLMRSAQVRSLERQAGDVMGDVVTIGRYHSLDHIIDTMRERDAKLVVVNDSGTLAGIITETNLAFYEYMEEDGSLPGKDVTLLRRDSAGGRKQYRYVFEISAVGEDLMTRPVVTTPPETPLSGVIDLMKEHRINSVVVTGERDDVQGIVTRDDILREVAQ